MALIRPVVDRVMEASTTTGTGTYTLAGAVTGYQSFAAVGNAGQCYYCAMDVDVNGVPAGGWEVGVGTYTLSGTTLARTRVDASSNADAAVNWAAGTRRIFLTHPGRFGVPLNGWTKRNSILYNNYLAPHSLGIHIIDAAPVQLRILTQSLGGASTYTAIATIRTNLNGIDSVACGLYVYDGTKAEGFEVLSQSAGSGGVNRIRVIRWTNVSTPSTVVSADTINIVGFPATLKIVKDGTNRTFYYYENGAWTQFWQEAKTDHLTETDIGIGGFSAANSSALGIYAELLDWRVTSP